MWGTLEVSQTSGNRIHGENQKDNRPKQCEGQERQFKNLIRDLAILQTLQWQLSLDVGIVLWQPTMNETHQLYVRFIILGVPKSRATKVGRSRSSNGAVLLIAC